MTNALNIYCDESAHLEHDGLPIMVLGAVWCPLDKVRETAIRLREIKARHGLKSDCELKWTGVSRSKVRYYLDVLDYFFDDDDLHFRALIIDKAQLDHEAWGSDHDSWYYRMYFTLIEPLLEPDARHRIYLDIKDTRSEQKVRKLHDVLCNSVYDFDKKIVERVQHVRSHEVEHVQLADFLMGAIRYCNEGQKTNQAKLDVIARMKQRSGLTLDRTTLVRAEKVNLLRWRPRRRPA